MSNLLCSIEEESTEDKERIESTKTNIWEWQFFNEKYKNQLSNHSPDDITDYFKLLSVSYDTENEKWNNFIENLRNEFQHKDPRCIVIGPWTINYIIFEENHNCSIILDKILKFLKKFPENYPEDDIYLRWNHGQFDDLYIVGVDHGSKFICLCYDISIDYKYKL